MEGHYAAVSLPIWLLEENSSEDCDRCDETLEKYKCAKCDDFQTNFLVLLKRHLKEDHTEQASDFKRQKCPKCSYETWSKYLIVRHKNLAHGAPLKSRKSRSGAQWLRCEYCQYKSQYKHNLSLHQKNKHPDPKEAWLKCQHCSFESQNKHVLKRHEETHLKEYSCSKCSFKAKDKLILAQHRKEEHTEIKWFQCPQCPFKSDHKGNFLSHQKHNHVSDSDQEWFRCKQCSFKTNNKYHLQRHTKNKHTALPETEWFKCQFCPYKGKQKYYLLAHQKRMHPTQM